MSATPSSSISRSSIQLFFVKALHFNSQAAYINFTYYMPYLIVWIFIKHLSAYIYALIKFLSVELADCQEKWIHICVLVSSVNFI